MFASLLPARPALALAPRLLVAAAFTAGLVVVSPALRAANAPITFTDSTIGALPDGFFTAPVRQANAGTWQVQGAGTLRHLAHLADPSVTMRGMSVAVLSAAAPADVRITTRLRVVDADRAAGIVSRYRDPNTFYFTAVFGGDHSIGLFRVTGGNRIQLDRADRVGIDWDAWHTMTVTHQGDQIRVMLNGIAVLQARDTTLPDGRVGVWSAGNSTSWFDDVAVDSLPD